MRAQLILCDFAQVADGKLTIVGGGWNARGPNSSMSIGILVGVPWTDTNEKHTWSLELLDQDGRVVELPAQAGPSRTLRIEGAIEVGRPAGVPPGTELPVPIAVNAGRIPLGEGAYEWRLGIDGRSDDDWRAAFRVRPAPG